MFSLSLLGMLCIQQFYALKYKYFGVANNALLSKDVKDSAKLKMLLIEVEKKKIMAEHFHTSCIYKIRNY